MPQLNRFVVSPPFGNWIGHPACTRVIGSLTLDRRRGLLRHVLATLRPTPGGWVNRIGLRNPGLRSIRSFNPDRIYSLAALAANDWETMYDLVPETCMVELNMSCPNVETKMGVGIDPIVLAQFCRKFAVTIAKLSVDSDDMVDRCVESGVRYLHLSNTLPTPRGGESGRRLFGYNVPFVARIAGRYPAITIIAGGGIYSPEAMRVYQQAGAAHFSLSTVFFTPWRVPSILGG